MVATRSGRADGVHPARRQFLGRPANVVAGHSSWRSDRAEAGAARCSSTRFHSCDILGWLFGPVERVYATTRSMFGYSVEDAATLTIEHANGVIGNLVSVFNGVQHREERRLEVFFERASVELTTDFVIGAPEDSFLVHRADEQHASGTTSTRCVESVRGRRVRSRSAGVRVPVLSHHAFAAALRAGRAPSPDVEDALRAHALVEGAYRSARRGGSSRSPRLDI